MLLRRRRNRWLRIRALSSVGNGRSSGRAGHDLPMPEQRECVTVLEDSACSLSVRQWRRNLFTERLRLLGEDPIPEATLRQWWPGTRPMNDVRDG
jgi:hypothetical protein